MSWQSKTPDERRGLRKRRGTRRDRSERNIDRTWREKERRVRAAADEAAHEFDRLRARIKDLPEADRDRVWEQLAGHLRRFEVTERRVHTGTVHNRSAA